MTDYRVSLVAAIGILQREIELAIQEERKSLRGVMGQSIPETPWLGRLGDTLSDLDKLKRDIV